MGPCICIADTSKSLEIHHLWQCFLCNVIYQISLISLINALKCSKNPLKKYPKVSSRSKDFIYNLIWENLSKISKSLDAWLNRITENYEIVLNYLLKTKVTKRFQGQI